jgi:hypothetical protein
MRIVEPEVGSTIATPGAAVSRLTTTGPAVAVLPETLVTLAQMLMLPSVPPRWTWPVASPAVSVVGVPSGTRGVMVEQVESPTPIWTDVEGWSVVTEASIWTPAMVEFTSASSL